MTDPDEPIPFELTPEGWGINNEECVIPADEWAEFMATLLPSWGFSEPS